jgi:hypothetical protein
VAPEPQSRSNTADKTIANADPSKRSAQSACQAGMRVARMGAERVVSWMQRACAWSFPPMRSYEELCEGLSPKSLLLFSLSNPVRRVCIHTVRSKPFERLSLLLILCNCVFLAMDSNDPDFADTQRGHLLRGAEWFFLVAFTLEMALKILGLGLLVGRGAYLRDAWNVLDCIVVLMGWISLSPKVANVSAMRTVRVLRPLRTITGVEGMRMLVATLLSSLPMLLDVLILCAFLFLIFGTIGVQTFAGYLRYECGAPVGGTVITAADGVVVRTNVTTYEPLVDVSPEQSIPDVCGDDRIKLPAQGAWFASNGGLLSTMLVTCQSDASDKHMCRQQNIDPHVWHCNETHCDAKRSSKCREQLARAAGWRGDQLWHSSRGSTWRPLL